MTIDETKNKLDLLFDNVRTYRSSKNFKDLLDFCANFKTLAPYNAMLVRLQMPGAKYVLTASEWRKKYDRGLQPNARPLVVLFPFGPVDFVFEIQDTIPLHPTEKHPTSEQILEELARPYKTKGKIVRQWFQNLIFNLQYHSISFDSQLFAASNYGAKIELLKQGSPIDIILRKDMRPIEWSANYLLSTNIKESEEEVFAGIAHELGHFFCRHLLAPVEWNKKNGKPAWKARGLSHEAKEFEAESVAWLICERVNIENPSEKYLSCFMKDNLEIPEGVSIERIFNAFNQIWAMCTTEKLPYDSGLLFTHNQSFQTKVKSELEKWKRK